ncbi:Acetyl-CoA acetyltransferase, cytosolic [Orobanche hederae]
MAPESVNPRDVCIVGVARTPMGGFLGALSSLAATKLGSIAIQRQAPARQAALGARLPDSVVCTTINKVCASGMKGKGSRLGHDTVVDGMLKDGLWDVYNDFGMGVCAELCADHSYLIRSGGREFRPDRNVPNRGTVALRSPIGLRPKLRRSADRLKMESRPSSSRFATYKDDYAIQSFERGIAAQSGGAFNWEITPVEIPGGRGKPSTLVDKDNFDPAKLKKLRPSFKETGGSVTAGNSSSIWSHSLL